MRQVLTFTLSDHLFGIDILRVQELKGWSPVTAIPNTPPHVRGVINLRGTIIPVIDLRSRFGMEPGVYHQFTVVVVVTVGSKLMGLMVDGVADVLDLPDDGVQAPPSLGTPIDTQLVSGLAQAGDRLVVLLDLDRVLAPDELAALPA